MKCSVHCFFYGVVPCVVLFLFAACDSEPTLSSIQNTFSEELPCREYFPVLKSVWGSSGEDVFAVGNGGGIFHYNGAEWTGMHSGTGEDLLSVYGFSSSDVYSVGRKGTILHFDGDEWTIVQTGFQYVLAEVWGSNDNEIFTVGSGGTMLRSDGTEWTRIETDVTYDLYDLWGSSGTSIWIVGGDSLAYFDGQSLNTYPLEFEEPNLYLFSIHGFSSSDIYLTRVNTLCHYDGNDWNCRVTPEFKWPIDVWGYSPTSIYLLTECDPALGGHKGIFFGNGDIWIEMASGIDCKSNEDFSAIWGLDDGSLFVVGGRNKYWQSGSSGFILRYCDYQWDIQSMLPSE